MGRTFGVITALTSVAFVAAGLSGSTPWASAAAGDVPPSVSAASPTPVAGTFTSLPPTRILDTRTGIGAPTAKIGPRSSITLSVAGQGGVPTAGATAVVLNLTGVNSSAASGGTSSYVTAWPTGTNRPTTSNLNLLPGQTSPNLVTVKLGSNGKIDLYNNNGRIDLLADVAGYYHLDPRVEGTLSVGPCTAALRGSLETDRATAAPGDRVAYDLTVRNDASGSCLRSSEVPVIEGSLALSSPVPNEAEAACPGASSSGSACVTNVAAWLEIRTGDTGNWTVVPSAEGLTTPEHEGDFTQTDCPGGTSAGCGAGAQATYGNIAFDTDPPTSIPCGPVDGACTAPPIAIAFRYFPSLSIEDQGLLDQCHEDSACHARMTVAATTTSTAPELFGLSIPIDISPVSGLADAVNATVSLPSGDPIKSAIPDLAPGEQQTLQDIAAYDVPENSATDVVSSAEVEYTAEGAPQSLPLTALTPIVEKIGGDQSLTVSVDVSAVTAAVETPLFATATARGAVQGPVELVATDGSGTRTLGQLHDDGTGGDLLANDAAFSGSFAVTSPEGTLSLVARATIDGKSATSPAAHVDVTSLGVPTTLANPDPTQVLADGGGEAMANVLLIRFADGTSADAMRAAAASIGGTLAGRVGETWQVTFAAVSDLATLKQKAARISEQVGVIGAEVSGKQNLSALTPNDPDYSNQYAPHRARADEAWVTNQGGPVLVGVIDEGIQANHPDLAGRVLGGRNFLVGATDPQASNTSPASTDEAHGTHVAGIIAAAGNNGTGVAGVNWKARIIPARICSTGGCLDDAHTAESIRYVVSRGARVINMSFGGPSRSEVIASALQDAYFANTLAVAAAGNCGSDWQANHCAGPNAKSYPGALGSNEEFSSWFGLFKRQYINSLVTVGATGPTDRRADFSSHGSYVDIAAPGSNILSTVPGSSLEYISGTSQASPFVAGAASLLFVQHPFWNDLVARARLITTAHQIADSDLGSGRVDVFSALVNAGFDTGNLGDWTRSGTAAAIKRLGPVVSPDGSTYFASISTGPESANDVSRMSQQFPVLPGSGPFTLRFRYNFVTDEYPEYVGSDFNDVLTVDLALPDGSSRRIVTETVNATHFTPVTGIDLPGGDDTVGQEGWISVSTTVDPPPSGATLKFYVADVGDSVYDSVALIDDLHFS